MKLHPAVYISIRLGIFLGFTSAIICAKNAPVERPSLSVAVFNDAGISSETVRQAERISSNIFKKSGIHVDWVDCGTPGKRRMDDPACRSTAYPDHVHVRILLRSLDLKEAILGIAPESVEGIGTQVDIFYEGIERLHQETFVNSAIILGDVVTHEIGHLLLGENSHSHSGIMRAHWHREELEGGRRGQLLFSDPQSRKLRARLATATLAGGPRPIESAEVVNSCCGETTQRPANNADGGGHSQRSDEGERPAACSLPTTAR